jgi:Protein of unknown function (DUF1488)
MPLTRLRDDYLEQDGVRFWMVDEDDSTVACRVSHEALRDHGNRVHFSGTDGAVFEAYRELIEEVASAAYDAEAPFDDHGRLTGGTCRERLDTYHKFLPGIILAWAREQSLLGCSAWDSDDSLR